jgi:putative polymerase
MTQSLLGAAFLWTIVFFRRLRTAEARYVHLAVALYVALNLTVSWSLFSIKSAALLWFLLGLSVANDQPEGEQERKAKAPVPPATPQRTGWVNSST